jgi:integrase
MPARWKAFLPLKTFASLRWGEITALTRNDLDLERRTVCIGQQFVRLPGGLQLGPPKSRAGIRMVSFPAAILPELQHHLDTAGRAQITALPECRGGPWRAQPSRS